MLQKVQVHAINTKRVDRKNHTLFQTNTNQWLHTHSSSDNVIPHHLYFTTDEEIKEGDIVYRPKDNRVLTCTKNMLIAVHELGLLWNSENRKVVATTNSDLHSKTLTVSCKRCKASGYDSGNAPYKCEKCKGEGTTTRVEEGIPNISPSFLQAFVEQQGIWEVNLETDVVSVHGRNGRFYWNEEFKQFYAQDEHGPEWLTEKQAIEQKYEFEYKIKLNSNGEVIVHLINEEKNHTIEDLKKAFDVGYRSARLGNYKVDGTYQQDLDKFIKTFHEKE